MHVILTKGMLGDYNRGMKELRNYSVTIRTGGHSQRRVIIKSCVSPMAAARVAHMTVTRLDSASI